MQNRIQVIGLLLCIVFLCSNCQQKNTTPQEEVVEPQKKTIILAIDGGGIKGVIPATFLQAIEKTTDKQSYQLFDLIGGTSTGGIISVALTSPSTTSKTRPFNADEILNIYQEHGDKIFVAQGCKIEPCAKYYADHKGKGIESYCQEILGKETTLSHNHSFIQNLNEARVKQLFTSSYTVNSTGNAISNPVRGKDFGPYLFNWYDAINSPKDDYRVWEAARGTSAAPTYFPIAHVGGGGSSRSTAAERWVIDGGTMSNDPAIWGISEAFRTGIVSDLKDIIVISLGTGIYKGESGVQINKAGFDVPKDGNWSEWPWVMEDLYDLQGQENGRGVLLDVILSAVQMVSDSQLKALTKSGLQYYRLQADLTQAQSQMDNINPSNIESLIKTANDYISKGKGKTILGQINTALAANR